MNFFPEFEQRHISVAGVDINTLTAGVGEPLLLLHGFPQTHLCWRGVANALAKSYSVTLVDLRGYGDSGLPHLDDNSENQYSKRKTAADLVEVMRQLGYESFSVIGHDRGARVAHRMCLDYPKHIKKVAFLDIIPSLAMAESLNHSLALAYFHQQLLAQDSPLPENIFCDREDILVRAGLSSFSKDSLFPDSVVEAYCEKIRMKERFFAMCEDYRAAATVDLDHDRCDKNAGKRVEVPALVLWGDQGKLSQVIDVESQWRPFIKGDFRARGLSCGHFIPEEAPDDCCRELLTFLEIG